MYSVLVAIRTLWYVGEESCNNPRTNYRRTPISNRHNSHSPQAYQVTWLASQPRCASRGIRRAHSSKAIDKGASIMTTTDNPKVSMPSGKDEDPKEKG